MVAAFYPLAYAAERIGGPSFHVENLTPPGAEPHDLELTPREVGGIVNASVVLYLSHGFQPAVSKAVEQARGRKVDVLAGLPLPRKRPTRLARPPPLRAHRDEDRRRTASPLLGFVADMRKLDQRVSQRPARTASGARS